ncbi:MAG TPA: hypothetical protein DCE41_12975 [Cytophagales bacterium]|nr:hypothetical protein [Cytophagales bacterium]HAA23803.1 hypothetical protein [Cytophagales bacterium]HAP63023.1 hypothetical protein [Cytophagales bacterium]
MGLPPKLFSKLNRKGIAFEPGLTDREIEGIRQVFGVTFPIDLKEFLQTGLPVSERFVPWRAALNNEADAVVVKERLRRPLEGLYFSIEHNHFWWEAWGEKPATLEDQKARLAEVFPQYPVLIPIYSHRYIPSSPDLTKNPVFSVVGTDIIYYGNDLVSYFEHEFGFTIPWRYGEEPPVRHIPFWSEIVAWNDTRFAR